MISPRQFIRETGFHPRKTLGQNFLVHAQSAEKIVRWAAVQNDSVILEIGPGLGALSESLLNAGCEVIAVEKDGELAKALRRKFLGENRFTLLHRDALELRLDRLGAGRAFSVVANLPYSVSTPLLEMLLSQISRVREMVLLFQEEVVERICAEPGTSDYGRLTVWVQTMCEVERGPRIPRGSFYPQPDVESRLVRLVPRKEPLVPRERLEAFLGLVAKLFQHRRKTVRNALRDAGYVSAHVDSALERARVTLSLRPEALPIERLFRLNEALRSGQPVRV